jgi:hypothetical protein
VVCQQDLAGGGGRRRTVCTTAVGHQYWAQTRFIPHFGFGGERGGGSDDANNVISTVCVTVSTHLALHHSPYVQLHVQLRNLFTLFICSLVRVIENRVLGRIFGLNGDEVTDETA